MVVIWRRLQKAVGGINDTEWAILAVETFGVFLGILLAFQLDGWAESVREAREQQSLMERLLSEAETNVANLRSERDDFEQLSDTQFEAIDRIFNKDQCTAKEWEDLRTTGFYPALPVVSAVYEEMVGAGGLGLLPNAEVRNAVAAFSGSIEGYRNQQDFFRNSMLQQPADISREYGIVTGLELEQRRFIVDRSVMYKACEDHLYLSAVASEVRNFGVIQNWREGVTESAIQMCAALARELDAECRPADGKPLEGKDLEVANEIRE